MKRWKEYLPGAQLYEPEETYRLGRPGRSGNGLQAAVLEWQGRTLGKMARVMGRGVGTACRRPSGTRGEVDGRHYKGPGRPRLPNPERGRTIEGDLDGMPRGCGFGRDIWSAGTVAGRTPERLGAPYSVRPAIRPAHRPVFSARKPPTRPVERRRAGGTEVHQEGTGGCRAEGRTVVDAGAATLRDPPVSRRGIRRRGGRGAVPTNRPGNTFTWSAPRGTAPRICSSATACLRAAASSLWNACAGAAGGRASSYHNAGALASSTVRKRLDGAGGDVGVPHLPSRAPQLDPVEAGWRETETAVADIFFGGPDRMRDAIIRRMIRNGEMPTVKVSGWLPAAWRPDAPLHDHGNGSGPHIAVLDKSPCRRARPSSTAIPRRATG